MESQQIKTNSEDEFKKLIRKIPLGTYFTHWNYYYFVDNVLVNDHYKRYSPDGNDHAPEFLLQGQRLCISPEQRYNRYNILIDGFDLVEPITKGEFNQFKYEIETEYYKRLREMIGPHNIINLISMHSEPTSVSKAMEQCMKEGFAYLLYPYGESAGCYRTMCIKMDDEALGYKLYHKHFALSMEPNQKFDEASYLVMNSFNEYKIDLSKDVYDQFIETGTLESQYIHHWIETAARKLYLLSENEYDYFTNVF